MTDKTAPVLKITRTFDTPRARVFDAWTNPKSDIGWWGPKDFTLLFNDIYSIIWLIGPASTRARRALTAGD
jgi:hypothetical protein